MLSFNGVQSGAIGNATIPLLASLSFLTYRFSASLSVQFESNLVVPTTTYCWQAALFTFTKASTLPQPWAGANGVFAPAANEVPCLVLGAQGTNTARMESEISTIPVWSPGDPSDLYLQLVGSVAVGVNAYYFLTWQMDAIIDPTINVSVENVVSVTPTATVPVQVLNDPLNVVVTNDPNEAQTVRLTSIQLDDQNEPLWVSNEMSVPKDPPAPSALDNLRSLADVAPDCDGSRAAIPMLQNLTSQLPTEQHDYVMPHVAEIMRWANRGDEEFLAIAWNRLMHAINGNTTTRQSLDNMTNDGLATLRAIASGAAREKPMAHVTALSDWVTEIADSQLFCFEGRLAIMIWPELVEEPERYELDAITTEDLDLDEDAPIPPPPPQVSNSLAQRRAAAKHEKVVKEKKVLNFNNSIRRVAAALGKKNDRIPRWWREHPESLDYRKLVLEQLWGRGWTSLREMTTAQWYVYCQLFSISREACLYGVLSAVPGWEVLNDEFDLAPCWKALVGEKWADGASVFACERDGHNKEVHALNGNTTSFCRVMKEVDDSKGMQAFYASRAFNKALPQLKGSNLALKISTQQASTNPTQLSNTENSVFRADVISATNVVALNRCLLQPGSTLVARQIRSDIGNIFTVSDEMGYYVLATLPFDVDPLQPTELANVIVEAAIKSNMNLGRADNTCLNGFNAIDLAFLGRIHAYIGLSLDQFVGKMICLHNVLAWANDVGALPLAQVTTADPRTHPDLTGQVLVTFNTLTRPGENSGGTDPTFPMSGTKGTLAFHLSSETIPRAERSTAWYFPTQLALLEDPSLLGQFIALFVACIAPWPFGFYEVSVDTTSQTGGVPAVQEFACASNLVHIPGQVNINIVLPRNFTSRNPTTQGEANSLVLTRPSTGPFPTTGAFALPASTPLNIAYTAAGGAGLTVYSLCDFLYTWADAFDITTIANFLTLMGRFAPVRPAMGRMQDLIDQMAVRYHPMIIADVSTPPVLAPNSTEALTLYNVAGILPTVPVAYPVTSPGNADYICPSTDPIAWNKVATGLAVVAGTDPFDTQLDWVGNVNAVYWQQLRSNVFAAFWSSHYANLGWPTIAWNTAFANTTLPAFRELARGFYAIVARTGKAQANAAFGPMMADYFTSLTGAGLGCWEYGDRVVTIFDCMCPPKNARPGALTAAGPDTFLVPQILPDVWVQALVAKVPKWQSSFPTSSGPDSLAGFSSGLTPVTMPNGNLGPTIDPRYYRATIRGNETLDASDEARWNSRISYVAGSARIRLLDNTLYAGVAGANDFLFPHQVLDIQGLPPIQDGLQAANTLFHPTVSDTGQILFAVSTPANMQLVRRAMYRQVRLSVATWQVSSAIAWNDIQDLADTSIESAWMKYLHPPDADSGKESPSQVLSEPGRTETEES
jgi:hypothetical protein